MNPMDLKRGAQAAVEKVVQVLEEISRPISTKEEIAQVGEYYFIVVAVAVVIGRKGFID